MGGKPQFQVCIPGTLVSFSPVNWVLSVRSSPSCNHITFTFSPRDWEYSEFSTVRESNGRPAYCYRCISQSGTRYKTTRWKQSASAVRFYFAAICVCAINRFSFVHNSTWSVDLLLISEIYILFLHRKSRHSGSAPIATIDLILQRACRQIYYTSKLNHCYVSTRYKI